MSSSQILNYLNKESHRNHSAMIQYQGSLLGIPTVSSILKDTELSQIQIVEELDPPPQILVEILNQQINSSFISRSVGETIQKLRKQREKNVFLAFNQSQLAYLTEMKEVLAMKNAYNASSIEDIILRRANTVTEDLECGRLMINRDRQISTKEQFQNLQEMDRARLLKIKQGAIRSKLDRLNLKMQQMERVNEAIKNSQSIEALNQKIQENMNSETYGLDSEKTKIAKDYVKFMNQQRRQMKKRIYMREQKRKKAEKERLAEIQEAEDIKDMTKRYQKLQKIDEKRIKKQEEEKYFAEKQQQVEKFLEKYKQQVPIFKKKELQFEQKVVKLEKAYREQKLKQIKQKKKSFSLNDIETHQRKYNQLRQKQIQRKQKQQQMLQKQKKIQTKQHYKGISHKYIEQEKQASKQKIDNRNIIAKYRMERIMEYANKVKVQHKPKVDDTKKLELMRILYAQEIKNKNLQRKFKPVYDSDGEFVGTEEYYEKKPERNRYKDGNLFMEQGNLLRKKDFSKSVDQSPQNQQNDHQISVSKSSIREKGESDKKIWKIRSKQLSQITKGYNSPKQFQQIKLNMQHLDKKAASKEQIIKHANLSVDEYIQQKGALDQYYLESIKNKIKLLEQ